MTIAKQIAQIEEANKHRKYKGISFAMRVGNNIEYINIPIIPDQAFVYFENTSKLTPEERKKKYEANQLRTIFTTPEV